MAYEVTKNDNLLSLRFLLKGEKVLPAPPPVLFAVKERAFWSPGEGMTLSTPERGEESLETRPVFPGTRSRSPETRPAFPETQGKSLDTRPAFLETRLIFPETRLAFLETRLIFPETLPAFLEPPGGFPGTILKPVKEHTHGLDAA
jgi:hypothetical protein